MSVNIANNFCRTCGCHFPPDGEDKACRNWEDCRDVQAPSANEDTKRLDHIEHTKCYPFWNGGEWVYIVAPERSSKATARGHGKTVREAIDAAADRTGETR